MTAYREFIEAGHTDAEWDDYAVQQNTLSRERGDNLIVELWANGGVPGNDIANLLRERGVEIPEAIARGLEDDDTVVSIDSITGRGMTRKEASAIHRWVSLHIR